VSTEESGIKRYTLTERGEQFFEEQNFKKIQKKIELSQPFFFNGFWLSPHSEKIKEIRKPIRDFFAAAFNLRIALRENLTEQAIKEVGEFLSETTGRIEELSERIKKGR
jgi:DNA-binding PadR family transcriptional regulator